MHKERLEQLLNKLDFSDAEKKYFFLNKGKQNLENLIHSLYLSINFMFF